MKTLRWILIWVISLYLLSVVLMLFIWGPLIWGPSGGSGFIERVETSFLVGYRISLEFLPVYVIVPLLAHLIMKFVRKYRSRKANAMNQGSLASTEFQNKPEISSKINLKKIAGQVFMILIIFYTLVFWAALVGLSARFPSRLNRLILSVYRPIEKIVFYNNPKEDIKEENTKPGFATYSNESYSFNYPVNYEISEIYGTIDLTVLDRGCSPPCVLMTIKYFEDSAKINEQIELYSKNGVAPYSKTIKTSKGYSYLIIAPNTTADNGYLGLSSDEKMIFDSFKLLELSTKK